MKGPVPEAWHTSTISPQENVNYVTDNVGTAGSQVSCEVHGTTHREFLESFFFPKWRSLGNLSGLNLYVIAAANCKE